MWLFVGVQSIWFLRSGNMILSILSEHSQCNNNYFFHIVYFWSSLYVAVAVFSIVALEKICFVPISSCFGIYISLYIFVQKMCIVYLWMKLNISLVFWLRSLFKFWHHMHNHIHYSFNARVLFIYITTKPDKDLVL